MPKKKFSFKERLKSFKYAFNGVWLMLKEEHNFRIHLFAAVLVIFCSWFFKISYFEWLLVLLLIGWVLCMEIVNTCIEKIMNFI